MAHENPHHGKQELDHDPLPLKTYLGVLGSLGFLTFLTVYVTHFDFGMWDLPIAMVIAVAKASLVVMYFMNLKFDPKFNAVVFLTGFFFLIVFTIPTLWDRETRQSLDPHRGGAIEHVRHGFPPQVTGEAVPGDEQPAEAAQTE